MTLPDGHFISNDGSVADSSQVEMTEIAIDEEQQPIDDAEHVQLSAASASNHRTVTSASEEGQPEEGAMMSGARVMSENGILTIAH